MSGEYEEDGIFTDTESLVGVSGYNNHINVQPSNNRGTDRVSSWIINDTYEEHEAKEDHDAVGSKFYKNHPTYKVFKQNDSKIRFSIPFILVTVTTVFINIIVLLIYPFNNDLVFGGGTLQQWIVIFDVAAGVLLILWLTAKVIQVN